MPQLEGKPEAIQIRRVSPRRASASSQSRNGFELPPYWAAIAERFPATGASLLVRHLCQPEQRGRVAVERAADWLARLAA